MTRLLEEEAYSRPALSFDTCQLTRAGSAPTSRRLWVIDEHPPCLIVRYANGQALALVSIGEEEPGPASSSHGVHCHHTVMRGQLRIELARSVAAASLCLVPTHLRFSAAQAATRFTKSSKPKRGRRPSLSK
jgi:hypothetical protein